MTRAVCQGQVAGEQEEPDFAARSTADTQQPDATTSATPATPAHAPAELAWRTAFVRDATPALRRRAVSFVRRRLRGDASEADELVQDVLADTYLGVLSWDPARYSLISHVCMALRARLHRARVRAHALPHISLEACDDTLGAEVEDTLLAASAASDPADMRLATQVIARLRHRAASDPDVTALLEAMRAGSLDREPLIDAMGADARRYAAARARLDRMVEELPHSAAMLGGGRAGPVAGQLALPAPPPQARTPGGRTRRAVDTARTRGQRVAITRRKNREVPFEGHLVAVAATAPPVVVDEKPTSKSAGHVDPPPLVVAPHGPHLETQSGELVPGCAGMSSPS